tara:strand:+ start:817 stop:1008 length:192 start_codon:yes stop_codon:yes gene_type:complete
MPVLQKSLLGQAEKEREDKKEEVITIDSGKCQSSNSDKFLADHAPGAHERLHKYTILLHFIWR